MADSMTEAGWISDGLGQNGKEAQIKEFERRIQYLEGGHRERLQKELRSIPSKVRALKAKIKCLKTR